MNPTEALYCFFMWLAEQPRKYIIGGGFHGGDVHAALAAFCEENNLPYLEDGWESKAKLPAIPFGRKISKSNAKKGYVKNNAGQK